MGIVIAEARNSEDFDSFAGLIRDYTEFCRTRYQDDAWFVDEVLGYQSLDSELADLAGKYSPPQG